MSSLFSALARIVLVGTLVVAPWPFGGYPLIWQPPLFAGVLTALVLWWISVATRPVSHPEGGTILVDGLLPPMLLILIAALQLIPFANVPDVPAHAVLADAARAEIEASSIPAPMPISVAPAMTRVTAARLLFAICAAFLGIQLFRDARSRMWLYVPLAVNAAAIAAFGMWQNAHWEEWGEMLFGTVKPREGGHPFGSYVNRNNAAGLLNMGAAAAAAWAFLAAAPRIGRSFRRTTDDSRRERSGRDHERQEPRPPVIFPVLVLVTILAGVAASLSRGGLLALAAGVVAALLILLQTRRSRMVISVVFVVLPLAALAIGWFGFGKEIRQRFAVLNSYTGPQDGRFQHWSETWGAVQDAPWMGQGMGAYRYIHRPYQQTENDRWYVNADNQFFELLVENGAIGVLLVLATLGILFVDVRRLLESRAPWEQRDAALLGGILLTSQAAQGLTDFGITLPANLLTAGTLAGVVAGTAARALPFTLVPNFSSPMVFRPRSAIPIGLCLIAGASLAWREVALASAASVATDSIGTLDAPDSVPAESIDAVVNRIQNAAAKRPDDAELQRTLGNLLTFRFRSGVFAALKTDPAAAGRPRDELWSRTGLEQLFGEAVRLEDERTTTRFQQALLRVDPQGSLPAASDAYQSAVASCRWVVASAQRNALAQIIVHQDANASRRSVALAAVGAPADGNRLISLGVIARELGADDLAIALWRQAGVVAPKRFPQILAAGGEWIREPEQLSAILPRDLEAQLSYAESPAGTSIASLIASHVEQLIQEAGEGSTPSGQLGRVRRLQGNHQAALEEFQKAIRDEPFAWKWRVRAAEAKADLGRLDEAIKDLEEAVKEFPRQSEIQQKWLKFQQHRLPASQ